MTVDEVQRAKARHEAALLRKPNVVGVAIGKKVVGGRETDEVCLVVLVRRKVPPAELRAHELVPARVDDVMTDVVETGDLVALGVALKQALPDRTARWRPAPGGVSVGHLAVTAGTLGCVVLRDGERLLLSNAHVVADTNRGRPGDPVLQPAPADGGRPPEDVLATLAEAVPVRWTRGRLWRALRGGDPRNRVDAAVARPLQDGLADDIVGLGPVEGTQEAALDLEIRKSGRTTGVTEGRVTHVDATVTVGYGEGRQAVFEGQILATGMSEGGDSGAVAVAPGNRAVGLLFAGSPRVTVLNPIQDVLEALDLRLRGGG